MSALRPLDFTRGGEPVEPQAQGGLRRAQSSREQSRTTELLDKKISFIKNEVWFGRSK